MAVPAEFKNNPLKWATMDPVKARDYILNMPLEERKAFIKTLSPKAKTLLTQRKAYLERQSEITTEQTYKAKEAKVGTKNRRKLLAEIDDTTEKIFRDAGKPELIEPFKEYVRKDALRKNAIKRLFGNLEGVAPVDYGHTSALDRKPKDQHLLQMSARSIIYQKMTPTTALSRSGVDNEAVIESRLANVRHGPKNVLTREMMQLLNRPINQKEAATNFLLNRPDLKGEISIADYYDDSIKMSKLTAGEINIDALEMENMLEGELKKAGVFKDTDKKTKINTLKRLINEADFADRILSATDPTPGKKVWQRNLQARGDLSQKDYARQQAAKLPPAPRSNIKPLPSAAAPGLLASVATEQVQKPKSTKVRTKSFSGTRAFIKDDDTHVDQIGLFMPIGHLGTGAVDLQPF